jgi:hypothetical protein
MMERFFLLAQSPDLLATTPGNGAKRSRITVDASHPSDRSLRLPLFLERKSGAAHVHVERDEDVAKFWLDPVRLAANYGFRNHELNVILKLVVEQQVYLRERWYGYFAN